MTNDNHKKRAEFSAGLGLFLVIVALMTSGSTLTTMVCASHNSTPSGSGRPERPKNYNSLGILHYYNAFFLTSLVKPRWIKMKTPYYSA